MPASRLLDVRTNVAPGVLSEGTIDAWKKLERTKGSNIVGPITLDTL